MIKRLLFLIIALVFVTTACDRAASSSTPVPATVTVMVPLLVQTPLIVESPTAEPSVLAEQTIPIPSSLQVVYLRDGNLWSWTEAEGNVLLTGTGDFSAIRLSEGGQLLAFMRGPEVWTIRMDGADARLLMTQKEPGGALSLAPDESSLAVSTSDHIDVIDLESGTSSTVVTYLSLPNGYYPEIVWSVDSTGFKTIMPPRTETGRPEFLFVFPNGKAASLAKFEAGSLSESPPIISPDGGYVIFSRQLAEGDESLYLMDSSGAAKVYGEPAEHVRALGWMPDSKQFVYVWESQGSTCILFGGVKGEQPVELEIKPYETIRWLDERRFLAGQDGNLLLGDIDGSEMLIAAGITDFDFKN